RQRLRRVGQVAVRLGVRHVALRVEVAGGRRRTHADARQAVRTRGQLAAGGVGWDAGHYFLRCSSAYDRAALDTMLETKARSGSDATGTSAARRIAARLRLSSACMR